MILCRWRRSKSAQFIAQFIAYCRHFFVEHRPYKSVYEPSGLPPDHACPNPVTTQYSHKEHPRVLDQGAAGDFFRFAQLTHRNGRQGRFFQHLLRNSLTLLVAI